MGKGIEMLYADSDKRIESITQTAELFKSKGYHATAKEILTFVEILKGDAVPADFLKKLDALFDLHQKEFEAELPVGQDFRKRCFEEIKEIVFKAISRLNGDYAKTIITIHPLLVRLNISNKVTGSIADELANNKITDQNVVFHLRCYAYLVFMEGVFDELARVLYFMAVADRNNVPKLADLERMTVWEILGNLKNTHVFLERWEEKKHIRNAIGHARASYDISKNIVRFVDQNWDSGNISIDQFAQMALELEDSLTAFLNIFLLLKIFDFVAAANAYA